MRIVAEKLNYTYNAKSSFSSKALKDITLQIDEGEFFGIIGHTGSGKSTFIQHINGLIKPTKECKKNGGVLKVGDFDLMDKKCDFILLRSKIGMVFQYPEYQLFAETVFADVAFGYKNFNRHATAEEVEKAVKDAIALVGLNYDEIKDKSPFELSGGQKRRVAIAGVLVTKPQILILDEPAAGLDPIGKKEVMLLLHALQSKGVGTVVLVSHDMDDIAENCTKVAVFNEGCVEIVDTPKNLFKQTERLKSLGLDIPQTAKCVTLLKEKGIEIDTDFTMKDFSNKVLEIYKQKA